MIAKTKRLLIREFTLADLDDLANLLANPEVMRFSLSGPLTREKTQEMLEKRILQHYEKYGFGLYAVIHEEKFIGFTGLIVQNIDGEDLVELGYRFDPKYWGQGFATEAAIAISHYAFDTLKLDEIISIIESENTRSLGVASRVGMYLWKKTAFHGIPVQIYALEKLSLRPYQKEWAETFQEEKENLKKAFQCLDIDFYHIGSTSIPGCSAKPIIDILGVTSDVTLVDRYNKAMGSLGFEPLGEYGMRQRRFFRRKRISPINLHIFEDTDPEVERHLRFCNYLRSHPEKVKEYSELKKKLVEQFPAEINPYVQGKEKFIKEIDVAAAKEAKELFLKPKARQRKKEWTSEEIQKAAEVNMHLHKVYFAKCTPSLNFVFQPDVTIMRSRVADPKFNCAVFPHFTEKNVKERIKEVAALFEHPFIWWIMPSDKQPHIEKHLMQAGQVLRKEHLGMVHNLADFQAQEIPSEISFQRVENKNQLKDFSDLTEISEEAYASIMSQIPPILYKEGAPYEMYVAYVKGKPVAGGVLLLHANIAGIYELKSREKKLASLLAQFFIARAKSKGYSRSFIQVPKEEKEALGIIGI